MCLGVFCAILWMKQPWPCTICSLPGAHGDVHYTTDIERLFLLPPREEEGPGIGVYYKDCNSKRTSPPTLYKV